MMMQQMMTYQAPPWADNQPLGRSKTACSGQSKAQSMQSSHGFIHLLDKLLGIVLCLFARTHMQIVKFMHLPQTNKRFIESSSCSSRHYGLSSSETTAVITDGKEGVLEIQELFPTVPVFKV